MPAIEDKFLKPPVRFPPNIAAHQRARCRYHPTYYAAFVIDPDGFNVEAVCHTPE